MVKLTMRIKVKVLIHVYVCEYHDSLIGIIRWALQELCYTHNYTCLPVANTFSMLSPTRLHCLFTKTRPAGRVLQHSFTRTVRVAIKTDRAYQQLSLLDSSAFSFCFFWSENWNSWLHSYEWALLCVSGTWESKKTQQSWNMDAMTLDPKKKKKFENEYDSDANILANHVINRFEVLFKCGCWHFR